MMPNWLDQNLKFASKARTPMTVLCWCPKVKPSTQASWEPTIEQKTGEITAGSVGILKDQTNTIPAWSKATKDE